ncbi:histidinol-phosphatase HisJ [Radiobacillus kanasensis]|uniref:histidinol-phosphatase HisJ n=1 Tax=Radiobacillus kanasensis TaxID=2844358 RepID=UPI001E28AE55|nr:histidinol-phosphatase HisJ [Radiobacillus kanasensis]UFU01159.1 histidinol-phosphatase HisJ [Radiobacillus kanasensis]
MKKGDFHVHSPYCPHGSNDSMEEYVRKAIEKGMDYLTFTEHAPFPESFIDPVPNKDSAMSWADVEDYINDGLLLKEKYKHDLQIKVGFEVDFIEGYEKETTRILDYFGTRIEDSILSVHMLRIGEQYVCIDYSDEEFGRILSLTNGVDSLHRLYYQTVKRSILANLGSYKPRRIGHITLVEKFRKKYPATMDFTTEQDEILSLLHKDQLELDVNSAGFYKEWNENAYPPQPLINKAKQLGIPLITGSDSHTACHIGRGFDRISW